MEIPRTGSCGSLSVGLGAQLAGPGFWVGGTLGSGRESLALGPWICRGWGRSGRPGLGGCPGLALTACLLCADPSLPRPSISLSPTGVTAPGADVTIQCQGQRQNVTFFLHKAGDLNPQRHVDPAGDGAEFRIPTVGRQHGGNYSCSYQPRSEPFVSSQPSDPVQLVVAGEDYPKPNISLSPSGGVSLGGNVSVWCRGQRWGMRFVLNKERRNFLPVDTDNNEAVFPINNVRREDGGSYSCSYHSRSERLNVSYPSDPVELVVRGEVPGLASPFPTPPPARPSRALGANGTLISPVAGVSILQAIGWGPKFPLRSSVTTNSLSPPLVNPVTLRETESHPLSCLLCADPNLPRPSISLSPTGITAPGADVTIQCQGQHQNVTFFLHKAGDQNPQRQMDPAGARAEFRILTVGRQHGGNYSCSYRNRSEPFVSSEPSDPVQLVVAGEEPDFTNINVARLGLSAAVLLVLGLILAEAYYSHPRGTP
uniref:Ig-like domain-containing protein n=1 Tax=Chrysemys picta bellii TaxID=8478 RepID=A0A8C3P6C8_CHRPI